MSRGGRLDRFLDRIPGYAGYRDKERRRDSDRIVREQLALEYGQLAERLGRLATGLAQDRAIMAIPLVDRPHKRLVSFIDRVRTASYGYSPLFSDNPIGADALDQLAAFDRALGDQRDELESGIIALEGAEPKGEQFKQLSRDLTATIEGLHDRFDKRNQVMLSGQPLPAADVLSLIEVGQPTGPSVAYRLHEGEAVSYGGENYTVIGRITVEAPQASWRAFQLRGGTGDVWLLASAEPSDKLQWLRRADLAGTVGEQSLSAGGTPYTLDRQIDGSGEVIGQQGMAGNQSVRFFRYRADSGAGIMSVFEWATGTLALAGFEVDPRDVHFFSRER
jgi:hypothetical protein